MNQYLQPGLVHIIPFIAYYNETLSLQNIRLRDDIKFSLNEYSDQLWFLLPQQALFYMTRPAEDGFTSILKSFPMNSKTQVDKTNTLHKQLTRLNMVKNEFSESEKVHDSK